MHKENTDYNALILRITDSEFSSEIFMFNGCSGSLVQKVGEASLNQIYEVQISSIEHSKPIWSGPVRFDESLINFELLIRANDQPDSDLNWSALPKVLSIFDGGYRALEKKEIERLLSDLIDFHERVTCKVHFQDDKVNRYISVRFTEQENLKTLTEVLVQVMDPTCSSVLDDIQTYVLEIELFETTYFMVSTLEEREDDLLVFKLTTHFYGHSKREGRRIHTLNHNISIPEGRVLEVSDFGIRIETKDSKVKVGTQTTLTIHENQLTFQCIFSTDRTAGFKMIDHSPSSRKVWQTFLLPFQYPDLVTRNPSLHESTWDLFAEAGYFNLPNGVGELVKNNKETVFKEWGRIDEIGPDQGTAVLSKDVENFIGTIGVSRINKGIWLSQALATSKNPKHIDHTRSLYAWRSRVIIQQQDGLWNLAFFSAKKVFLDRFFRKFLLLLSEDETPYVSWEEKNHYYILPKKGLTRNERAAKREAKYTSRFLEEFKKFDQSIITMEHIAESIALLSPPHLSLAQMTMSLWSEDFDPLATLEFASIASQNGHTFASLFLNQPIESKNIQSDGYEMVGGQPFVVWMCARILFPKFLANSLRAFELMHVKYGTQEVA